MYDDFPHSMVIVSGNRLNTLTEHVYSYCMFSRTSTAYRNKTATVGRRISNCVL